MNISFNFQFHITKKSEEKRLIVLNKTAGESIEHIILKLLAYLTFFDDKLQIETKAYQHYKPDLVKFDKERDWKVAKWIDCGVISKKKLLKISKHNRQAEICIFKSDENSAQTLLNRTNKKIKNISYYIFNKQELEKIKDLLEKRNKIDILCHKNKNLSLSFNNIKLDLQYKIFL